MIFVRKCLDYVFTKDELRVLDTVIPPFRQKNVQKLLAEVFIFIFKNSILI